MPEKKDSLTLCTTAGISAFHIAANTMDPASLPLHSESSRNDDSRPFHLQHGSSYFLRPPRSINNQMPHYPLICFRLVGFCHLFRFGFRVECPATRSIPLLPIILYSNDSNDYTDIYIYIYISPVRMWCFVLPTSQVYQRLIRLFWNSQR